MAFSGADSSDILMPLEQEGTKAVVRTWFKAIGDAVAEGEPLLDTPNLVMLRRRGTRRLEARTTEMRASRRNCRLLLSMTQGEEPLLHLRRTAARGRSRASIPLCGSRLPYGSR